MITQEDKAAIRQKFINHWNTVGRRRHGWIADPLQIGPVKRHHGRNDHGQAGRSQAKAPAAFGTHFRRRSARFVA